jgi:HlyD family secretion protein
MSATVDIRTTSRINVRSVPIQAVTTRKDSADSNNEKNTVDADENLKEVVFVIDGEKVKQTEVKTGIQNTQFIEILEGVEEGVEIVTDPYTIVSKTLKDGDNIEIVAKKELFSSKKK